MLNGTLHHEYMNSEVALEEKSITHMCTGHILCVDAGGVDHLVYPISTRTVYSSAYVCAVLSR